MLSILKDFGVDTSSVVNAVDSVAELDNDTLDQLWLTAVGVPVAESVKDKALKMVVQAIIRGAKTQIDVANYVTRSIELNPTPVIISVMAMPVEPVVTVQAPIEVEDTTETESPAILEPVKAKGKRGRPKMIDGAYESAIALIHAAGITDRKLMREFLVEKHDYKQSSAYVYVWRAGKEGRL